jgi:hypothetical protein
MKYFIPTDKSAETNCYGAGMCSAKKPVGLDGYLAGKASRNPEFTEVVKAVKVATKKKVSKKKATKKV